MTLRRCGFEIELMAPIGKSRETLAHSIAKAISGKVTRCFYPQSEVDTQKKSAGYETLTLAFKVTDRDGNWFATFADDITLNADINKNIKGESGWYRILTTEKVTRDLASRQCNASDALDSVLLPLAELFGTNQIIGSDEMHIVDSHSATVAVALPLAGDRQRACEIITCPLESGHREVLDLVIENALSEGFILPREGAIHIHFDGARFLSPPAFRNLVVIFHRYRLLLKEQFKTNAHCTRLGPWPTDFLTLVGSDRFLTLNWEQAKSELDSTSIQKWCDFNVLNLIERFSQKCTFEVRILPSVLNAELIYSTACYFDVMLKKICDMTLANNILPLAPTLNCNEISRAELARFLS
jgi:Putative amidoligase enzyme